MLLCFILHFYNIASIQFFYLVIMDKIPKGDNVLKTLVAGLESEDGGGGQQEDGDEAEHAEASSDHAMMSTSGISLLNKGLIFSRE
jgi:hypothetical protein